jgi:hypothetical protein
MSRVSRTHPLQRPQDHRHTIRNDEQFRTTIRGLLEELP